MKYACIMCIGTCLGVRYPLVIHILALANIFCLQLEHKYNEEPTVLVLFWNIFSWQFLLMGVQSPGMDSAIYMYMSYGILLKISYIQAFCSFCPKIIIIHYIIYLQGEPEKRIPYVINYIHQHHSLHTSSSIILCFMTS